MTFRDRIPETGYANQRGVSVSFAHGAGSPKIFEGTIASGTLVPFQGATEHGLARCLRSKVNYPLLRCICDTAHWAECCTIPMGTGQGVLQ